MEKAIILFRCVDQRGIISSIADFIFRNGGNITKADQHSSDQMENVFFLRIEFSFDSKNIPYEKLINNFKSIGEKFNAKWQIFFIHHRYRMGILASKSSHCLAEILYRNSSKELKVKIPFIISNHQENQHIAEQYNIPYYYLPIEGSRISQEQKILKLAKEQTDFLVLARYMQILSPNFLNNYQKDIINIHHSFLPSFSGSNPYGQAFDRGVKIIGATAHFVTNDLDEGPIIQQMVENTSHRDNIEDLIKKGKSLEKLTLSKAVQNYVDHKIIIFKNKTIVFE